MPAPRKPHGERTSAVLGLRLTESERKRVEAAARKTGQSFSSFAREALMLRLLAGDTRDVVARVSKAIHDRARNLADDAAAADSRDGSSAAGLLERSAILHEIGDAIVSIIDDEWWSADRGDPDGEGDES